MSDNTGLFVQAFRAGVNAAKRGKPRELSADTQFIDHISDNSTSQKSIVSQIQREWLRGYDLHKFNSRNYDNWYG